MVVYAANYIWPKAELTQESLVAVVRCQPDLSLEGLIPRLRDLNRRLPDFKRIDGVVPWQDAFPRTASMKVKRANLAQDLREELQARGGADPMTTWTTIVNGAAGGGRCASQATDALNRLREGGLNLDVHFTQCIGHASDIAKEQHAQGSRHFITVGGDGTTYEVINGLFPRTSDDPVTLGFLPLGTGNSFIRDFGINDTQTALDALIRANTTSCDVVRVEHSVGELHYINLMSVGFSAKVGALTNKRFKPFGAAGYAMAVGVSVLGLEQPRYRMSIEGGAPEEKPCTLISFSNSRYTGGTMMMAPSADPSDGAVDIIHIGKLSRLGLLKAFPKIYQGSHVAIDAVDTRLAKAITFHGSGPVDCMIDGENYEPRTPRARGLGERT